MAKFHCVENSVVFHLSMFLRANCSHVALQRNSYCERLVHWPAISMDFLEIYNVKLTVEDIYKTCAFIKYGDLCTQPVLRFRDCSLVTYLIVEDLGHRLSQWKNSVDVEITEPGRKTLEEGCLILH